MPISEAEATKILKGHLKWVASMRPRWQRHRNLFGDRFWDGDEKPGGKVWLTTTSVYPTGEGGDDSITNTEGGFKGTPTTIQVNLLRPLITSFVAPLGYQGLHFSVKESPIDPQKGSVRRREQQQGGLRLATEYWFDTDEVVDTTERAFTMGLLYEGGVGYRVGLVPKEDAPKGCHVLDRLYLEALPPWEAVWDRRSRSVRSQRYIGHLRTVPVESVQVTEGTERTALPDVVADGARRVPNPGDELDDGYLFLFEVWDLTSPEGGYAAYRVGGISQSGAGELTLEAIQGLGPGSPAPERRPDGGPVVPIIPFIAEPKAEFPLDSLSVVSSPANLNAELNKALSTIGEAFRRDASRVLLYLKDKVDTKTLDAIANAPDMAMVAVDAETLEGLMQFLDVQPISGTILEYIGQIFGSLDRVQLTADMTRGKAGKYLSATESAALVEYSETMIGRVRRRMDTTHSKVAQTAVWLLRQEAADEDISFEVEVDGKRTKIDAEVLGRRWEYSVIDTASTPGEKAQRLADLQLVMGTYERNVALLSDPQLYGTPIQRGAAATVAALVELASLGEAFSLQTLLPEGLPTERPEPEAAPEEAPEEMPPEEMPAQMPMGPEEQAMLQTPEAQAIMEGGM